MGLTHPLRIAGISCSVADRAWLVACLVGCLCCWLLVLLVACVVGCLCCWLLVLDFGRGVDSGRCVDAGLGLDSSRCVGLWSRCCLCSLCGRWSVIGL